MRARIRDELGIAPPVGRLLAVDLAPNDKKGGKVLYLFDGGQLSAESEAQIHLRPDELPSYAYVTSAEVAQRTIRRLARRIQAAMGARDGAAPIYLEHGQFPAA